MKKGFFFIIICIALLPLPRMTARASFPEAPQVVSEGAILMDAESGIILYEKNAHERLYPASTTKILTTLIAARNAALTDTVTFSDVAVNSVPADGSKIGISAGEALTMEQCIYAILVGSANEVSNAVAEHVAGSIPAFVERMNETAQALGCTDSHFMNTNGLHDEAHYTSAYDLATIGRAFFDNALLCTVSGTARYHFEPTDTQPDDIYITNKHKLVNGEMPYEGVIGGKTGYTSNAQETLVTCAEQDGMKLIAVVMKAPSPEQFNDTVTLFNYGFRNFRKIAASGENAALPAGEDFYGNGETYFDLPLMTLTTDARGAVILPNDASLDDCEMSISYPERGEDKGAAAATIRYTLDGRDVGNVEVYLEEVRASGAGSSTGVGSDGAGPSTSSGTANGAGTAANIIYIELRYIFFVIGAVLLLVIMIVVFRRMAANRTPAGSARRTLKRRREIKRRWG